MTFTSSQRERQFAQLPQVEGCADVLTRHSDLDFNDHVNNVHYVEWMLDGRMENAKCKMENGGVAELDIVFRQAAKAGESLVSECCTAGGKSLHAVSRRSDGALLATAAMVPFARGDGETKSCKEE